LLDKDPYIQDILNPYITNRPISDPSAFFGRKELLTWARERLVKGDRILLLHGIRRIGKTSFLLQLPYHVPAGYLPVRLDLRKMSVQAEPAGDETVAHDRKASFMWAFCRAVAQEMAAVHALNLIAPQRAEFARDASYALRGFLTDLRQVLGNNVLLLMLDDLDALPVGGVEHTFLFDLINQALERRPGLRFLITARRFDGFLVSLKWAQHAPAQRIGLLSSTEAQDLLKSMAAGRLVYDPAAVRRVVELASGHPYYLQLLGYALFNRCLPSGEVSLPDVSATLEDLLPLPFDEFDEWWAVSLPSEKAVLALLGELKGQGGVFTSYEAHKALTRRGVRVKRTVVEQALQSLAERGVLEHLGAISYRARIELFRIWLSYHAELQMVARKARWRVGQRPMPATAQELATEFATGNWLTWAIVTAAVLVVVFLIFRVPQAAKPKPTATPTSFSTPLSSLTPGTTVAESPSKPVLTSTSFPATTSTMTAVTPTATDKTPSSTVAPVPPGEHRLLYMRKEYTDDPWQLYLINVDGTLPRPVTGSQLGEAYPVWDPSGRSVAFVSERDGNKEIYIMLLDGTGLANLTRHPADDWTPAWSPDGQWIAFVSFRDENWELYAVRSNGTELIRLTENKVSDLSPVWSPDGQTLAFASKRDGNWEIYLMPWHGNAVTRLTKDPGGDLSPSWSPDGQWIAFESTRDGDAEVYLMRADGSEQRNLTNWPYADEHGPVWSPDGQWIAFYSNRDGDWDIYIMDREGENLINLTDDDVNNQSPVWSP